MDIGITVAIVSVCGSLIIYGLGWLNGRKKRSVDIEGQKLTNIKGYIEIYEKYQQELKNQLDLAINKYIELTTRMEISSVENRDLVASIFSLSNEMEVLKKENVSLIEEMRSMRIENAELKKQIVDLNERLKSNGR